MSRRNWLTLDSSLLLVHTTRCVERRRCPRLLPPPVKLDILTPQLGEPDRLTDGTCIREVMIDGRMVSL